MQRQAAVSCAPWLFQPRESLVILFVFPHDGLRAVPTSLTRPTSARATHPRRLSQRAAKFGARTINHSIPESTISTASTAPHSSVAHTALPRSHIPATKPVSADPFRPPKPELSTTVWRESRHAPAVRNVAQPSGSNGHGCCVRSRLRISSSTNLVDRGDARLPTDGDSQK